MTRTLTMYEEVPAISARACLFGAALVALGALALSATRAADAQFAPTAAAVTPQQFVISSGIVTSIRELPFEHGRDLRRFEMTIRMRDGTMRVGLESGRAQWLAGDKVRMIDTAADMRTHP